RDAGGADISLLLNPIIGPNCLEVPITGEETKDGAFDGGYAFADYCPPVAPTVANPTGTTYPCDEPVQLVPGDYITHVVSPDGAGGNPLYRVVAEEDVNVDEGDEFVPQIPPPPCAGDLHQVVIDPEVM